MVMIQFDSEFLVEILFYLTVINVMFSEMSVFGINVPIFLKFGG